jgi:hypothetical protein
MSRQRSAIDKDPSRACLGRCQRMAPHWVCLGVASERLPLFVRRYRQTSLLYILALISSSRTSASQIFTMLFSAAAKVAFLLGLVWLAPTYATPSTPFTNWEVVCPDDYFCVCRCPDDGVIIISDASDPECFDQCICVGKLKEQF